MSDIPLHLQRRFEQRWAARFAPPGASAVPKSTGVKRAPSKAWPRPPRAKKNRRPIDQRNGRSSGSAEAAIPSGAMADAAGSLSQSSSSIVRITDRFGADALSILARPQRANST